MYENFTSDYPAFNRIIHTAVDRIREIDKRHIIFIEGDSYGHNFSGLEAPFDDNLVYSSHDYIVSSFGPGAIPANMRRFTTTASRPAATGITNSSSAI